MSRIRLQHKGKPVSIEIAADADKVRNHAPLRFRMSHDVTVNTGVNTWFMSRDQLDRLSSEVLTEILEAKEPGFERVIESAEARISAGQATLVRTVREIGHLTHPDVLMLIDMRQNPNQYVNEASVFAAAFNGLARKVMDLSFYATLHAVYSDAARKDFIKLTGAVTRGMNQFIYCRPNASAASPYVNFSVIPAEANYEEVRFPVFYNTRTGEKERIPKNSFQEHYAFYVNELFDTYRRYLRLLLASSVEPGNEAEVSADILAKPPGEGPGEGGAGVEAVIAGIEAEQRAEAQADIDAQERKKQQQEREEERKERKEAKKAKKRDERRQIIEEGIESARAKIKKEVKAKQATKAAKAAKQEKLEEYELGEKPQDPPQSSSSSSLVIPPSAQTEADALNIAVEALFGNRKKYESPTSWSSAIKAQRTNMGKVPGAHVPSHEAIKQALREKNVANLE